MPPPPLALLLPPQAVSKLRVAKTASGNSARRRTLRRPNTKTQPARETPAAGSHVLRAGRAAEAEALTAMVTCEVAATLEGVTLEGLKEQVVPVGRPEQAKVTAELKPFCGVTVRVSEPWLPDLTVSVETLEVNEKDGGGAATISVMVVVTAVFPLVPVTVMV